MNKIHGNGFVPFRFFTPFPHHFSGDLHKKRDRPLFLVYSFTRGKQIENGKRRLEKGACPFFFFF
jgi:hypothetical protein